MQMRGRDFASGMGYRYGIGSQETDNEVSGRGNSYTAEFWQYDSRLGRRWNLDPVDQVFLSNYSVNGCNPILFRDPRGAKFGKGKAEADWYKSETIKHRDQSISRQNSLQAKLDQRIASRQDRDPNYNSESDKKANKYRSQIRIEEQLQNGFSEVLCELEVLEKSDWVYDIELINDPSWDGEGKGGEIGFNLETNHIEVKLNVNWKRMKTVSHELKHAYQFEQFKLGFRNGQGYFYDLEDEVEAHKRSQLYGFYKGENITTWWVYAQGYKGMSHTQLTTSSLENSYKKGYWELYYYNEGRNGTHLADVIIINVPNWAAIYMKGVESCSPHK
jgi:hypothetical protein